MRARTTVCAVALLAIAASAAAGAVAAGQLPAPSSGALTPQAGPEAAPPSAPPFAQPLPGLSAPNAAPPSAPGFGAALVLGDVSVLTDAKAATARPRRGWRPPATSGGGLSLSLAHGQALDAGWVREQFVQNGLVGAQTTADRVVSLVLLINEAFSENGYVNTGVVLPPQGWPASGGILELRLITGRLASRGPHAPAVTVGWAAGGSQNMRAKYIRDRMPSAERAPLNAIDIEHDFRVLADDPALETINAQLTPAALAGYANLSLVASPQPWIDLYAGEANSRNPSVGPIRSYGGGTLRNSLFSGDALTVDAGETSGLLDGVISYATPVVDPDTVFDVQALGDNAAVIDPTVRSLDIRSKEASVEAGLTQRLIDEPLTPDASGVGWTPAQSFSLGLRAARRWSSSSLLGAPFSFSPGEVDGVTNLTVLRAVADYVRRSDQDALAMSATVSTGLFGSRSDVAGAPDPHFTAMLAQLNYARRLTGGGLELRARLQGQWSSSPLYPMEQISAGGADTVRGYRENLLLADEGIIGSIELGCPIAVGQSLCAARSDWKTLKLSVFTDGAYLADRAAPQPSPTGIASVGASLAWTPTSALFAQISYGYALVRIVASGPQDLEDRGVSFAVTVHPLRLLRLTH